MAFVTDGTNIRKALLRFDEVREILGCSRDHIYDLLRDGKLQAQNPNGRPGSRGTRIIAASLTLYIERTTIPQEEWNK